MFNSFYWDISFFACNDRKCRNTPFVFLIPFVVLIPVGFNIILKMTSVWNIPSKSNDAYYLNSVGRALELYTQIYDKIILASDFNAGENEMVFKNVLDL